MHQKVGNRFHAYEKFTPFSHVRQTFENAAEMTCTSEDENPLYVYTAPNVSFPYPGRLRFQIRIKMRTTLLGFSTNKMQRTLSLGQCTRRRV